MSASVTVRRPEKIMSAVATSWIVIDPGNQSTIRGKATKPTRGIITRGLRIWISPKFRPIETSSSSPREIMINMNMNLVPRIRPAGFVKSPS